MNTYLNKAVVIFLLAWPALLAAQNTDKPVSGLNEREFKKYWQAESESPDYKLNFLGDTLEIVAPKGFTLWRKEKMSGHVTIEYDACIMDEGQPGDRLSDLNCFWMATDPLYPDNIMKRAGWRQGIFRRCYSLAMYYVGYGGNYNSTTRFRRYDGNYERVEKDNVVPAILREYTDPQHLLEANKWYRIRISNEGGRVCYYVNGERLVDFRDPDPHRSGWFGFRTTLARARITNFSYTTTPDDSKVPLKWIGSSPQTDTPVSFGVPFDQGIVQPQQVFSLSTQAGRQLPLDNWVLAYWPDGSVKWGGFATVAPAGSEGFILEKAGSKGKKDKKVAPVAVKTEEDADCIAVHTGFVSAYFPRKGSNVIDSITYNGTRIAGKGVLTCRTQQSVSSGLKYTEYESRIDKISIERAGNVRATVKIEGSHTDGTRNWLPFTVRMYFYAGSDRIRLVHSFVYDGDENKDFINSLGISFDVPLREAMYNRHVLFAGEDEGIWAEPVQPLTGRRVLSLNGDRTLYEQQTEGRRIPEYEAFDNFNRNLIDHWASWDGYRLSQTGADGFTIRKRATADSPWIGTAGGNRSRGLAFVGDVSGGLAVSLSDFWESYPSSIEINGARSNKANMTVWLWSPDAEPMDLRHYDTVAHDLNASYEDVQEGLSTPYGIARTSVLHLVAGAAYPGKEALSQLATELASPAQLICTPEYLHSRQAFGVWSLPDRSTALRNQIEDRLDTFIDYYQKAIEEHRWYGFWNYGDVMHSYDPARHAWRYDIGGFAWDNTELASNMWLWYSFLRTGRRDIWKMAEAMSRHTGEVDVYHTGPYARLGTRHNVSHWGCGAKEARISQAAWNRFYYYLTTDERTGDLMTEVRNAEETLYTVDPMRLAAPSEQYPVSAPTRIRVGPDWLAHAGNWLTEYERTGNMAYRNKIEAGMRSIASLPSGLFTGPRVLGFDPATGVLSYEGDPQVQQTNHLATLMGGFEINHELMQSIPLPQWKEAWLQYTANYTRKACRQGKSCFYIPRLTAYAAWQLSDNELKQQAWKELIPEIEAGSLRPLEIKKVVPPQTLNPQHESRWISTNGVSTWALDAIFMLEVIPPDE